MTFNTFIGLLILACIGAYFAWRNNHKVRQANAAAEFRKSFDRDFSFNLFNNFTIDKFSAVFATHKEAARLFTPHVFFPIRGCFNKKWNNYEQWAKDILTESLHKPDGVYKLTLAYQGRNYVAEYKKHIDSQ